MACNVLSYFTNHKEVEKPGRIQRCAQHLNNPEMKLYFKFLEFILVPLNEFNTVFQASDTKIGHLIPEMNRLLRKFLAKFVTMAEIKPKVADLTKVDYTNTQKQLSNDLLAVGGLARTYLVEEEEDISPTTQARFFKSARNFYVVCVKKMIKKFPFKDTVLKDMAVLNPDSSVRSQHTAAQVINLSERFSIIPQDQHAAREEEFVDYQLCEDSELPKYDIKDPQFNSVDQFWGAMSALKTATGAIRFPLLSTVMTTLSALAHSNADSERVFSMCRKIHTEQRSELGNDTMKGLLSSKINTDNPCYKFKPTASLLKSAKSVTWDYVREHQ